MSFNIFKFSKSKLFLFFSTLFIISIGIASFLPQNIVEENILFFGGLIFSLVLLVLFYKNKYLKFLSLVGLFLFLAFWRYSISIPINSPEKIWHYNGQEITFQGVVNKEPDVRQDNQKLEIKVNNVEMKNFPFLQVEGKVLVTTSLYPKYNYGDNLIITCNLQAPEKFNGFSYDRYLARYDIYSVCYYGKIEILNTLQIPPPPIQLAGKRGIIINFYKKIYLFKDKLREKIDYGMSEPEASLTKAIILGDKKQIPDDLREKFSQVGLSHIVAISGMHISIIAGILMLFLLQIGLSRRKSFYFASIFLFIYIVIIGFPASAIRAGIMGFLVLLALNMGRLNKLTNSLCLTAVILLLVNPKLLIDDIGFQLSFLAVLGIGLVYPILDNLFEKFKIPKLYGARDIINITISAQVFTLPLIAMNFNQISLVVIFSNLLIIWVLPILMISTILALALSFIFSSFSIVFFLASAIILKYVIIVTEILASLSFASIKIYYVWWVWVIVYYVLISWLIYKIRKN